MSKTGKEPFLNSRKKELLSLSILIIAFIIISVIFFNIIKAFLVPVILAATFTTLFYPLYKKLFKLFRKLRTLTALVFCFLIIIVILVPLYFIGHMVVLQGMDFYNRIQNFVVDNIDRDNNNSADDDNTGDVSADSQTYDEEFVNFINKIEESEIYKWLAASQIDFQSIIADGVKAGGKFMTIVINKTSTGIVNVLINVFFTFYAMFYFFRDGDKIIKRIRYLSPIKDEYEDKLIARFTSISRATIMGTVVIGIIQGVAGTVTFIIFGIKGWILWGVLMIILSIIPVVGSFLIMIPAAIYKIAIGKIWQGIIIIFVAVALNYLIDYLLRPILVGRESKMHDLLIFFSTLGGLTVFGVMGFIIGPMIAMIFITLLDIYGMEFKEFLH